MMSTPQGLSMRWHPVWRLALRVPLGYVRVDDCGNGRVKGPGLLDLLDFANIGTCRISSVMVLQSR